jgi:glutamate racemase
MSRGKWRGSDKTTSMSPSSPILVLDSGLGGLTVARALRSAMPHEDLLYFGDTARLPYGSKTAAVVSSYVQQIISHLLPACPKHVVIACNTATALALPAVRAAFPHLPVSGVVDPGAKAALRAAGGKPMPIIGVLATDATIRSKAYDRAIHRRRSHARLLLRAAPLLAPIIEEGRVANDPLVRLALTQYLAPMMEHSPDVLVLGCTHYPVYRNLFQELVGRQTAVIDSAEQCAQDVAERLRAAGLCKQSGTGPTAAGSPIRAQLRPGWLKCYVTDDPARFASLAPRFLGARIEAPTWVPPELLYAPQDAARAVRRPA